MTFTQSLTSQLPSKWRAGLHVFETIDSTNSEAQRRLDSGEQPPLLLLACAQTAGRGRHGRRFESPAGTGLYWTLVMAASAQLPLNLITPAAGVALHAAVAKVLAVDTQLKWVNDLLKNDRKVAGILTEVVPAQPRRIMVGVGVNFTKDPRRPETAAGQQIGSLLDSIPDAATQAALVAQFVARLDGLLVRPTRIMPEFRTAAAWLGQPVSLSEPGHVAKGRLAGFADNGALILETEHGRQQFQDGTLRRQ